MINALSIDIEPWWSNEFLSVNSNEKRQDQVCESVDMVLNLLDAHSVRATFFVLGEVAQKFPQIVETISEKGHEIGVHAFHHDRLNKLGPILFERDVKRCCDIISSQTDATISGFRAPFFSVGNNTLWALEILERHGFVYDSSVFPTFERLYGTYNAPKTIYRPSKTDITVHDPTSKMIEVPLSALPIMGVNCPFAGGFYLRTFPLQLLKWGIRRINQTRPAIMYVHPWELTPHTPKVQASPFGRFEAYYGINSTVKKLEALIREFRFGAIIDVLEEGEN
jgi:peptidoglycan-N-acetylglucosamine deacetylase